LAPITRDTVQLHFGSKDTSNFFPKETEVNNRLPMSSQTHSCLVTDHFLFEGGWGVGCGWANKKKTKFLHNTCRRIKIVHSGTKQRNTSQA